MNKQELEKMFDEANLYEEYDFCECGKHISKLDDYKVKQFIFETIIPEVLRDICIKQDFY
jgi:hypothetical protein